MKNRYIVYTVLLLLTGAVIFAAFKIDRDFFSDDNKQVMKEEKRWEAPNLDQLPASKEKQLLEYGRDLIANTSYYFGPKGSVARISNGMNCQNCHLDAGTRLNGNCFALVASTYPKYRERSGRVETIAYRINECMERSLNGKELDSTGKEMQAMIAYIKWVGKNVNDTTPQKGIATVQVPFLDRAADPGAGKNLFALKCQRCHAADGSGVLKIDSIGYQYPPLWGDNSFNVSAGMYRLTRLAAFIKYNMPYTEVGIAPQLTDAEAWDLAAYVSSQKRPEKFFPYDWAKLNTKPVDYPFGPYADSFTTVQHKFGPFKPIDEFKRTQKETAVKK